MTILFLLIASTAAPRADAQNEIPVTVDSFTFPSARFSGMGGSHVSMADETSVFFTNPAGFANMERTFGLAELTVDVKDINTMATVFMSDSSVAGILSNVVHGALETAGPMSLSWINRGFGIGLFNTTHLELNKAPDDFTVLDTDLNEEVTFACGYAWRSGDIGDFTFDFGLLPKVFVRGNFYKTETTIWEVRHILENLFENYNFQVQLGGGLDMGFRAAWSEAFSFALSVRDIYSPVYVIMSENFNQFLSNMWLATGMSRVKTSLQVGFAYKIDTEDLSRYITSITLMADYSDILGVFEVGARSPLLNIGAGIEFRLLRAMKLRFGWKDMTYSVGFGLDMTAWQLDIAFYGEEYGLVPGQYRTNSLALAMLFRYD